MDILNLVLIGAISLGLAAFIILTIKMRQRGLQESDKLESYERLQYSLDTLNKFTKEKLGELASEDLYGLGLSEEEFRRRKHRKQELKDALRNCNTGDLSSKIFVREYIKDILVGAGVNDENIDFSIAFNHPSEMSEAELFDTLLYRYQQKYKYDALAELLKKYDLANPVKDGSYRIYAEQIRDIYKKEIRILSFEDKLSILAQRIYSEYKGFGVIDDIRDMKIDGVSGGVSGLPKRMEAFEGDNYLVDMLSASKNSLNSIWVMFRGKSIHFSFLSFKHEAELRRVTTNAYKYGYPGQLSESKPYIINEMFDGSRVTVVRSKLSESWAFFIRKKYDLKNLNLETLFSQKNNQLPIKFIEFMMRANRITAVTGMQGTGKTTLLMGMVGFIHPALNLRIQETSFELNLRSLYPERNILSFQETDEISGQDGLDLQKKTDGDVNILGEVATDPVAAWFVQISQVASEFTLITHHAKTTENLVYALRNSLLKTAAFSNEAIAEQQVVSVLEFDIHLRQTHDGQRYIERITEIVPVNYVLDAVDSENALKLSSDKDGKLEDMLSAATVYFRQQIQRKQFVEKNIIEYRDGQYIAVNKVSSARFKEMGGVLGDEWFTAFKQFTEENWSV